MTRDEAIKTLKKMKTLCCPDELSYTIRRGTENEAIDIAISSLLDYLPIRPNPSHVQRQSRVDVVFKYSCGYCGAYVREAWKACPLCGKGINWDEVPHSKEENT